MERSAGEPESKRRRTEDRASTNGISKDSGKDSEKDSGSGHQDASCDATSSGLGLGWAGDGGYVHTNCQLGARWRHTPSPLNENLAGDVDADDVGRVETDALSALGNIEPILKHICSIKLVRNQRKNFINVRIKKELVPMVFRHMAQGSGTLYLFVVSLYVEPFVNVVPIHPVNGTVHLWKSLNGDELAAAVNSFKRNFGLSGESYRYTEDGASANSLLDALTIVRQRCLTHYCISIRIATKMLFISVLPIMKVLSIEQTRSVVQVTQTCHMNHAWNELVKVEKILKFLIQRGRGTYPELRLQFLSTVYASWKHDILYEIHLSDKFEPFAIAIAIDRDRGKLLRLSKEQVQDLEATVNEFKQKYGISQESYHYTSYAERMQTDSFVSGGGASMKSKAHSTDFHLKIRVGSKMYTHRMPIFSIVNFDRIKKEVEPVMYNVGRETVSWSSVKSIMIQEAVV